MDYKPSYSEVLQILFFIEGDTTNFETLRDKSRINDKELYELLKHMHKWDLIDNHPVDKKFSLTTKGVNILKYYKNDLHEPKPVLKKHER